MFNFTKQFEKIKRLKNLSQYFKDEKFSSEKLNAFMKKKQNLMGVLLTAVFVLAIIVLHHVASDRKNKNHQSEIQTHLQKNNSIPDGVLTNDFSVKDNSSALEEQQNQIDGLKKQVSDLTKNIRNGHSENAVGSKNTDKLSQNTNTPALKQSMVNNAQNTMPFSNVTGGHSLASKAVNIDENNTQMALDNRSFNTISFHYVKKQKDVQNNDALPQISPRRNLNLKGSSKTPNTWVPAGTFDRVVLLVGADANASVNGQSDTSPILIRFLDAGTLPNGYHSHLKGCFALASIYGDISSERGEARLNKISCTQKDGSILEVPVKGFISFAGKEGIRGTPVMRNGKILTMAGISGMLSGFGSALAQGSQTQSISPLGATTTVSPSQVWQSGAYTGASTAMGQLASYYIKRADQYHPIIDIGSGTVATVIFQTGFSLVPKLPSGDQSQNVASNSNNASNPTSGNDASEIKSLLKENQMLSQKSIQNPQFQVTDDNANSDAQSAPFSNVSSQAGGVVTNG